MKFVWNENEISNNKMGVNGGSLLESLSLVIERENENETSFDEKNENQTKNIGNSQLGSN